MFLKLFFCVCARERERFISTFVSSRFFCQALNDTTPNVSISRLKQLFKRQSFGVVDGHTCIIACCPICENKTKGPKVYVNKTTGYFICDTCRFTGSSEILEKILSLQSDECLKERKILQANLQTEENFEQKWQDIERDCQSLLTLPPEAYRDILDTFSLPYISQQDMQNIHCVYDSISNTLYFPLMTIGNRIVGYKSFQSNPERETTIPVSDVGGCIIYRKQSKTDGTAVVVQSIQDQIALISQKSAKTIICLPYKLQHLPQQLLPFLESFKKLILWFGNDDASWDTARNFAKKLNEKRCYFVRPTELQPRPKVAAEMSYDLKAILQNAQSIWHQSITTFQQLREDVLSDLQNNDKVQGVKWKRYPSLNRILKGHRRGEFTVLTGPTGCGKTTFMSEYSLDLAMQGINTLWGSFEIRNARLARTMLQQMVGVNLNENLQNFDTYADAFEKLPIYFMTFHGQQSIKVVMDAVQHATYVHDIGHVIIDNVQFMMGMSDESGHADRFWRQDVVISNFRSFATKYNCHVTVIIHPRKEREADELTTSSIFGTAKATQEADNILIIQDKRLSHVQGKKFLQVAKNRYSGDLGIMVLEFDKTSLSYAQKKKSKGGDSQGRKSSSKTKQPEEESIENMESNLWLS